MTIPFAALEDHRLVTLVLGGASESFSALMDRHLAVIRKVIQGRLKSDADADDIVQEVVLKVWLHLSKFRWESNFRTWMMRVALNEVFQSYRRRQRLPIERTCDDLRAVASQTDSPHQTFARAQEIGALRNAVTQLPKKYERVLFFHDLEELSVRETAQRLQLTIPTVKTRLFRARRMLLIELQSSKPSRAAKNRVERCTKNIPQ